MRRDFLKLCGMVGLTLACPGGVTSLLAASPKEDPPYEGPYYVVFNASARLFLDPSRRHRVDVGVNNLFDERYATSLTTGVDDVTGDAYVAHYLGQPRTLTARYTFSF